MQKYKDRRISEFYRKYVGYADSGIYLVTAERTGTLPENGAVVTTIVSGKMSKEIAKDYGMTLIETLTGFKYIGEQIKFLSRSKIMNMCLVMRKAMDVL